MPPLHPAFVHFPIALVVFSFITDLLGRLFGWASLRAAGFWCLIGALLVGAITAMTGYWDFTHAALGTLCRFSSGRRTHTRRVDCCPDALALASLRAA